MAASSKPSSLVETRVVYCGESFNNRNSWAITFVLVVFVMMFDLMHQVRAETKTKSELAIPKDAEPEEVKNAHEDLTKALANLHPKRNQPPEVINANGHPYILYGDLFHTGRIVAIAEITNNEKHPTIGIGLAEWDGRFWQAKELLAVTPFWRPENWLKSADDYLPTSPSTRPFWLSKLDKNTNGLVFAGEVQKYFQTHRLFAYDEKQHRLAYVAEAMAEPAFVDGYIVLYNDSGRRSIFSEWKFEQWDGHQLCEKVTWHGETPYNDMDNPFTDVSLTLDSGKTTTYRITDGEITRDDKPFVKFEFKPVKAELSDSLIVEAYLFEKLTGLPRKLYLNGTAHGKAGKEETAKRLEERKKLKWFEDVATITVSGEPEAVKMLTAKR